MNHRHILIGLGAALAIGACSDQQDSAPTGPAETPATAVSKSPSSYVIGFSAAEAGDLNAAIQRAGGKANFISNRAGLATAESADPSFAGKLGKARGVRGVAMDTVVQWVDPKESPQQASIETGDDTRFAEQWSLKAIEAKRAWDENGARGANGTVVARVAVLDGGLNHNHEDLAGVVRVDLSRSFIPPATPNFQFDKDVPCPTAPCFSHATHVAGIIAAKDNDRGTIGIAPGAEIVGVKVLHGGSGSFAWIISGIVYAANPEDAEEGGANADIINMSLGAQFPSSRDSKVRALKAFLDQATTYAHDQGTLVLAAAGNGDKQGRGIDHDSGRWFTLPAQSEDVVGVSALGPVGFATGAENFDRLASYSNFGLRLVDLSGPGGDFVFLPQSRTCTVVVTRPCWFFDQVLSPASLGTNETYFWAAGTSMSTPAVAGVAALVIGTKGRMAPQALFDHLKSTSDDLGAPSEDATYGWGRVNAFKATR